MPFGLLNCTLFLRSLSRFLLGGAPGQERFGNMTRVYYKEAVGAFIVFDVSRAATFDAVVKWKSDLDSKVQLPDGSPIPCILLANKVSGTLNRTVSPYCLAVTTADSHNCIVGGQSTTANVWPVLRFPTFFQEEYGAYFIQGYIADSSNTSNSNSQQLYITVFSPIDIQGENYELISLLHLKINVNL